MQIMQSNQPFNLFLAWGGSLMNWVRLLILLLTQLKSAVFANGNSWIGAMRSQLLLSFLFGAEQRLSKDQHRIFKVIGMLHILSASGFNVRVVSRLAQSVLQRAACLSQKIKTILIGLSVFIFFHLSTISLSLWRACLMTLLSLLVRRCFYRQVDSLRLFIYVCILMIVFDGTVIDSVSWQMSIAATGSIIWLLPFFQETFFTRGQHFQHLNYQGSNFTRLIFGLFSYFVQNVSLYLAAQVGILPIILLTWGELNLWGLVVNTGLSGLMSSLVFLALVWFIACCLYGLLPVCLLNCLGFLFGGLMTILLDFTEFLSRLGQDYIWHLPQFKPIFVWTWYGSWFLLGYLWRKKKQKSLINKIKIKF